MNISTPDMANAPDTDELRRASGSVQTPDLAAAQQAMDVLGAWMAQADPAQRDALGQRLTGCLADIGLERPSAQDLSRRYPEDFTVDDQYRATLPDIQNGPQAMIRGARRMIQHVGISNFRLPLRFATRDGRDLTLETSVTGTVSLDAERKGINMSRIMRSFYIHAEDRFGFDVVDAVLDSYKRDLDCVDARIQMRTSWPLKLPSLRSGLFGYQYYNVTFELIEIAGLRRRIVHFDYVYASTCPCSLELAEHAREERGQLATPHSQRSVARISMVIEPGQTPLWVEDIAAMCRRAVPTETQTMVKREDEQAFAELSAANPIFVEDSARLFAQVLRADDRIGDFRIVASHQESLHSHDAVSMLTEGPTFEAASLDPYLFQSLFHTG